MLRKVLRLLPALLVLVLAALALTSPGQQAAAEPAAPKVLAPPDDVLLAQIRRYRRATWRLQQLMGVRRTPAAISRLHGPTEFKLWIRNLWLKRAARAWRKAKNPPHKRAWLCIHRYEGAWDDPNPPYYGGLQMDLTFQRTYGLDLLRRKGTADNWTPLEQMWVAERAYRSGRGFYPWPNTARYCGLI